MQDFLKKLIIFLIMIIAMDKSIPFASSEDISGKESAQKIIKEFTLPTPYAQPYKIAIDKKGIVWFTEQMANKIGRFDPAASKFSEYPVPSAKSIGEAKWEFSEKERKSFTEGFSVSSVGSLAGIAIDSNGDIWFTEVLGNKIGKFSPDKEQFSEYEVPTKNSNPHHIAIDSKGDAWFTERNANKIGRFSVATSSFKEYDIPVPNSKPIGIAIDKDDNVWFAMSDANRIGAFEAKTGNIKIYSILTPLANPYEIAVDSKGNVWFTEVSANKLGMFSPHLNRFDETEIPTFSSVPTGIAIDRHDRIWFTQNRGNKIALFDPVKALFKEYEIPSNQSLPIGIAIDNSGNIWFVESERDTNKIGFIAGLASEPQEEPKETPQAKLAERNSIMQWALIILAGIIVIAVLLYIKRASKR